MSSDPAEPYGSQLRLIAGLGNPGKRYSRTRHNVGFMVVDELARRASLDWKTESSFHAEVARLGQQWLLKPSTFMNESGRSVGAICRFLGWSPAQVLVVYDDINLPFGRLRLRGAGSAGGHNGMRSIIQHLGSNEFARLRIGIGEGRRTPDDGLTSHVLGEFTAAEEEMRAIVVGRSADAVEMLLQQGWDATMNEFNKVPDPGE